MGDERYTTQRTTSSRSSGRSTSPHHAAYAAERAKILFGCYRRGDANDPDTYVAAIARVLSTYDTDLIREVTDPCTGIQTSEKFMTFMPQSGELKVYCDGVAARKERIKHLGSLPAPDLNRFLLAPPPPSPGDLASVFVPDNHLRYPALVEWSKTADERMWKFGRSSDARVGIWIAWDVWDNRQIKARSVGEVAKDIASSVAPVPAQEAAE